LDVTDAILHFIGDGSALSNLNASNVAFGTLSTSVFPASGVTAGTYGSSSNVSQVTIDQYGRVTAAANIASVSSQWTGLPGSSIYYIPGVSIGSSNNATANLQVTGNVYVSNSVTTTNVYATNYYGDGGLLSNIASQWTGTKGSPIYYVPNVSIGSSVDATANLQVTGNVYVSNSVTTTNVYATNYYGDGGLLSNVASQWSGTKGSPIYYVPNVSIGSSVDATANLQVTGNVYVSNAVTVPNVHVTDTLDVLGSMTANAANATFFFDTFTIPYINTQYLNVSANTTLTGNLVVASANIATLNVGYLTVNSAVVYGATTLNVYGVSNLSTVTANTLSMSGDVFIGNVAITGAVQTTTGPMSRLTFDNTANTSIYPNKIVLYANTASSQYCGFGVTNLGPTGGASIAYGARQNHIFNTGTTLNTEIMRIGVLGTVGIGTASATAKLHVGTSLTQNVQVLVEASNVAIATTGGGRVGFGTSTPSANLHVIGNTYVSNAVTTTNVFAATETLTGTTGQTTLNVTGNVYSSNAVTTTNVFASSVVSTNPIPFRNRLINGGMNIWQRNTASISTTTSVYTTADRWCGALGTSGLILSQWPGPTENLLFPYSLQVTTSTITTGTPLIEQRIENQNIPDFLNGTPVTVSFWVGQSYGTLMPLTVGLYYATAVNNFGTQTLAVAATQNTPTLTAANAYYSLSFTLTTALAATNGLSLRFTTGGASAIGSTFFLTGVQLEKGAVATPFEVRPYATELALAQRYYYQLTSPTAAVQGSPAVYAIFGTATGITTTAFWLPLQFPVTMRTPNYTVSNSAVTSFQLLPTGTTTITGVGVQSDSYTPVGATLNFTGTNIVPTASYIFRTNNLTGSTTAFFGFSCEL
jgi:hypothetical protein